MRNVVVDGVVDGGRGSGGEELVVESRRVANAVVMRINGELDMITVPQLREAIEQHLTDDVGLLVIDLTELSFLASSGLKLLLDTCDLAADRGTALRILVGQNQRAVRLLEVTGLDKVLPVHRSLGEVLGEHGRPRDAR